MIQDLLQSLIVLNSAAQLLLTTIQEVLVDFVAFEVEVLAPVGVGTEASFVVMFTDFSFVVLVKGFLEPELILSMCKAAVGSPFTFSIGLIVFTDFCFVFTRILKILQFLTTSETIALS